MALAYKLSCRQAKTERATRVILQRCRIQINQHLRIEAEHEYLLTLHLRNNQLPIKFIFKEEKWLSPRLSKKNPQVQRYQCHYTQMSCLHFGWEQPHPVPLEGSGFAPACDSQKDGDNRVISSGFAGEPLGMEKFPRQHLATWHIFTRKCRGEGRTEPSTSTSPCSPQSHLGPGPAPPQPAEAHLSPPRPKTPASQLPGHLPPGPSQRSPKALREV